MHFLYLKQLAKKYLYIPLVSFWLINCFYGWTPIIIASFKQFMPLNTPIYIGNRTAVCSYSVLVTVQIRYVTTPVLHCLAVLHPKYSCLILCLQSTLLLL